jgi:Helix-turn-helix of DDE superfamily endonuclease
MLHVLREHGQRKIKPGRPAKLSLEDQLLMTLHYWREYRTYFHIGLSWGVHESVACHTAQRIENRLIKSKEFHLPGKKQLQKSATPLEVIVVDMAESPVERPQKNSGVTTAGRKNVIPRKPGSSLRKRPARSSGSPSARAESTMSNCSSGARSP